jgi:hypothetical protein
MDWITSDLHSDIISPLLYPSSDEKDPATGTRQDQDVFVLLVKAHILFPKGRIFASFKQLDWLAKLCLEAWDKVLVSAVLFFRKESRD